MEGMTLCPRKGVEHCIVAEKQQYASLSFVYLAILCLWASRAEELVGLCRTNLRAHRASLVSSWEMDRLYARPPYVPFRLPRKDVRKGGRVDGRSSTNSQQLAHAEVDIYILVRTALDSRDAQPSRRQLKLPASFDPRVQLLVQSAWPAELTMRPGTRVRLHCAVVVVFGTAQESDSSVGVQSNAGTAARS